MNLGSSCLSLPRSWNCRPVPLGLFLCYHVRHWRLRLGSLRVAQVFAIWQRWAETGAWPKSQVLGRGGMVSQTWMGLKPCIPAASAFSPLPASSLPLHPLPRFMPQFSEFEMIGGLSHLMAKGLLRARSLLSSFCVPCQPSLLWQTRGSTACGAQAACACEHGLAGNEQVPGGEDGLACSCREVCAEWMAG